jgi:hypothetical protein
LKKKNKSLNGASNLDVYNDGQTPIADLELYNTDKLKKDVVKFRLNPIFNSAPDDMGFGKFLNEAENVSSFTPAMLSVDR